MMNSLLKQAVKPSSLLTRAKPFSGVSQRSLHTPLGTTSKKDDSYQVSRLSMATQLLAAKHNEAKHKIAFFTRAKLELATTLSSTINMTLLSWAPVVPA